MSKILFVGDSGVGKTCFLTRLAEGTWLDCSIATFGVQYRMKTVTTNTREFHLQLWDTAGQEVFRAITQAYYRDAIGAFVVFSLTSKSSFSALDTWLMDVKARARPNVSIILIGSKRDLADSADREVSSEEAMQFAEANNLQYYETSSRTGENVEAALMACLDLIDARSVSDESGPKSNAPVPLEGNSHPGCSYC
jgi:small GTP-binding protein